MPDPTSSFFAIDVGNSRIKVGEFERASACAMASRPGVLPIAPPPLAEPAEVMAFAPRDSQGEPLPLTPLVEWMADRVAPGETPDVWVASVNQPLSTRLTEELEGRGLAVRNLRGSDFPIENLTRYPDRVGVDRLAAAVAAGRLRRPGGAAIVVDFGTAITVDLVTSEGAFAGGAILPGLVTQARSLSQATEALPEVVLDAEGKSPAAVGQSTDEAIAAGLYWGGVGAVRELIARQSDRLVAPPQVFVTGSTSPEMARLLGSPDYAVRYVPNLVLSGIAVAAAQEGAT